MISPTPMVGPDDAYKKDNHTNPEGFRYEGEEFFHWLKSNGFLQKNFYIICGDRHWQYHSKNPAGFEEFSCGALVDANSRLGQKPGDPKSTDPAGEIVQYYTQQQRSGGFLKVSVLPAVNDSKESITFTFFDENGTELYSYGKQSSE